MCSFLVVIWILLMKHAVSGATCESYSNDNADGVDVINDAEIPIIPYNISANTAPEFQLAACDSNGGTNQCYIDCNSQFNVANCKSSEWTLTETNNVQSLTIKCDECSSFKINALNSQNTLNINNITILCNESNSCQGMAINYDSINNIKRIINIYCISEESCLDLRISQFYVSTTEQYEFTEINLYCIDHRSCSNTKINYSHRSILNMFMFQGYRHEDISIIAAPFESVNLFCGNINDKRYFIYDMDDDIDIDELIDISRDEYNDKSLPSISTGLPCEGIQIITYKPKYILCDIQYVISDHYDFQAMKQSETECYWIDVNKLLTPQCAEIQINTESKDYTIYWIALSLGLAALCLCCSVWCCCCGGWKQFKHLDTNTIFGTTLVD